MRSVVAGLAVILLAGCSSVGDIRKNPPLLEIESKHSAKAVAECIRDGWQATDLVGGSLGGILQTSGDRYTVIAPNPENPWHLADVDPKGIGSLVRYHFFRTWQSPSDKISGVVSACSR
jgi:hypothetical protein